MARLTFTFAPGDLLHMLKKRMFRGGFTLFR